MHKVEDPKSAIPDAIPAIKDFTGQPPRGWESPGLTGHDGTPHPLADARIAKDPHRGRGSSTGTSSPRTW